MAKITYGDHHLQAEDGESVLDTLLRNNIDAPYSCKVGVCQTCIMQSTSGDLPAASQQELKPNLREQGYFLSCQCYADKDLEIKLPESEQLFVNATLVEKEYLSPTVVRVRLQTATPLYYHAGQFINVKRADGLIRSYSLASLPSEDNSLELHVKRMDNGDMSQWITSQFKVGDSVEIDGPVGDCFYSSGASSMPILLVGSGTGLAPLIGILRDALHNNHTGPIYLYHAAFTEEELYLDKEIKSLVSNANNVHYKPVVTNYMTENYVVSGRSCEIALVDHPDLKEWQIYICGAPAMVKFMQQRAFIAGASMNNIHTDPFETKELRSEPR